MNFIIAIIDALVGFARRNPLLVLIILMLAIGAPALLKGIALFILYFMLGIILLGVVAFLLLRWRVGQMRQNMEGQFGSTEQRESKREGEVRVYRTSETPEKRVSKDVGDYVEFEETKIEENAETV
jgi:hypothetical protein